MMHVINYEALENKLSQLKQQNTPPIRIECSRDTAITMLREAGALQPDEDVIGIRTVRFMGVPMKRNDALPFGWVGFIEDGVGGMDLVNLKLFASDENLISQL